MMMQASSNGRAVQNGASASTAAAEENGHEEDAGATAPPLTDTNRDIVRLIGQYLRSEGLK